MENGLNYKKIIIALSGVILVLLVLLGVVFYKPELFSKNEESIVNTNSQPEQQTDPSPSNASIQGNYLNSQFRVLGVFQNTKAYPLDEQKINKLVNQVSLVVATDRSEDGLDYGCGGMYVMPTCYFFIEPESIAGAPKRKFVAKFSEGGRLDTNSITFTEPNLVKFTTADGDAGYMMIATWSLNLDTGEIKQLSKKETSSDI